MSPIWMRLLRVQPNPHYLATVNGVARWRYLWRHTAPAIWWGSLHCHACGRLRWPWQDTTPQRVHHACLHAWGRTWMDRGIEQVGPLRKGDGRGHFRCHVCGWEYLG